MVVSGRIKGEILAGFFRNLERRLRSPQAGTVPVPFTARPMGRSGRTSSVICGVSLRRFVRGPQLLDGVLERRRRPLYGRVSRLDRGVRQACPQFAKFLLDERSEIHVAADTRSNSRAAG